MNDCLALFDEGTAAPTESSAQITSAPVPEGTDAGKQARQLTNPGSSRRDRRAGAAQRRAQLTGAAKNSQTATEAKVQDNAAQTCDTQDMPAAEPMQLRRERFRALVDGEFKDLYTEAVQSIIDRRFRQTKLLEEKLAAQQPVVEALLAQHGIHDGDVAKLAHAMAHTGQPAPPQNRLAMPQQDSSALPDEQQPSNAREIDKQYDDWMQQAEQTRAVHSRFDLQAEVQNPLFLSMLKARVPMKHAYEVLHLEELMGGVAEQTEKRVLESIRAKGTRPVENGISSQNGITIHNALSQMSRKDRADIARRAARGERITF